MDPASWFMGSLPLEPMLDRQTKQKADVDDAPLYSMELTCSGRGR
jgi:hypothetical protein